MDWIQGERFIQLADEKRIFYRHTHDVNDFFKNLPTSDPFILISHNSDGCIMRKPNREDHADARLMPSNLIHWFGQNVNIVHDKITSLPIGMENNKWFPKIQKLKKIEKIIRQPKQYINLAYLNCKIGTNPQERQPLYDLFEDECWVTTVRGKNGYGFDDYLKQLHSHFFIFCPEGHGIDTVRTWESLYIGAIPIEKRNKNNAHYVDLPILFVNDWSEIDDKFLTDAYHRIRAITDWNYDKLTFEYWKTKILSYVK